MYNIPNNGQHGNITFYDPIHHDPAQVLAEFTIHEATNGQDIHGCIYADGGCSCSTYKTTGRCRHAAAWLVESCAAVYAMADADAERRAELYDSLRVIDIFAGEVL